MNHIQLVFHSTTPKGLLLEVVKHLRRLGQITISGEMLLENAIWRAPGVHDGDRGKGLAKLDHNVLERRFPPSPAVRRAEDVADFRRSIAGHEADALPYLRPRVKRHAEPPIQPKRHDVGYPKFVPVPHQPYTTPHDDECDCAECRP